MRRASSTCYSSREKSGEGCPRHKARYYGGEGRRRAAKGRRNLFPIIRPASIPPSAPIHSQRVVPFSPVIHGTTSSPAIVIATAILTITVSYRPLPSLTVVLSTVVLPDHHPTPITHPATHNAFIRFSAHPGQRSG